MLLQHLKMKNKKEFFFVIIFCLFLSINFLAEWTYVLKDFQEALLKPLTTFQMWFFNLFGILFDSLIVALIVGVFSYYFRTFKTIYYILFGILIAYFDSIFLLALSSLVLLIRGQSFLPPTSLFISLDSTTVFFLLLIQLVVIVMSSFYGYKKAIEGEYLYDDKESYYLFGVSKKLWVLLLILWNPLFDFLIRFTVSSLYYFLTTIISKDFWSKIFSFSNLFSEGTDSGLIRVLYYLFSIIIMWGLGVFLFLFGIEAIKNKEDSFRIIRIVAVFVVLPALIVFIPLIRNRYWFF